MSAAAAAKASQISGSGWKGACANVIVGLTGGIATGKSTVTRMFREVGAYVVDADVWARKVVEPGQPALAEIAEAFGQDVIRPDGTLDRQALAAIVFHDPDARSRLNAITHPRVRAGMRSETEARLAVDPHSPIIWDVPLLFEGDTKNSVDCTILVYVDEATQRQRLMARDGFTEAEAQARIAAQMSIEQKRALADYVIDNGGSLEQTKAQVLRLWDELCRRNEHA
ncbi:MAG: dephospho-CoA kinase [Alicyclobacillus sp.]|nr:dephospho-CoA kinase [Alicyclobacillus sp.]